MSQLDQKSLCEYFSIAFQQMAEIVVKAPGRVNLIGEHTDYNDGFVLPAAINYYTWVAAKARSDRELRVVARNFSDQQIQFNLDQPMQSDQQIPWSNYVRGVVQELKRAGFTLTGGDLYIAGNVPEGAGLSSSASLEIALIRALTSLSGEKIEPTQAALIGQAAENNLVGCQCGIMDQLISARGAESSALLIDCQDLSVRKVAIPRDWEILIVHSGVQRGLVESEYNLRRAQCETAAQFFNQSSLRGVALAELLTAQGALDDLSFRRARHVLSENQRTLVAAEALATGDMSTLMAVMAESHASMRDDFNITTPALDILVAILQAAGAEQAGARMTGGGFGGCVVAIAPAAVIPQLMSAVQEHYQAQTGCVPTLIQAKASAGAFAE